MDNNGSSLAVSPVTVLSVGPDAARMTRALRWGLAAANSNHRRVCEEPCVTGVTIPVARPAQVTV